MILYPSITVDLYKPYPLVILEVPQYNIGRGALVTLTAGGAAVVPTDEIIETYALKPDGTKVYNTAILAGNQVQINFSEQMTAVDGILQCELQMTDALGHSITTPIFAVRILPSNIDAKAITSSDDFQALVDALAQVQGFDQVKQSIGTLSELTTTAKDNLVAAINEVDGDIGDLSGLTTTAKNNLVAALNELNNNLSGGTLTDANDIPRTIYNTLQVYRVRNTSLNIPIVAHGFILHMDIDSAGYAIQLYVGLSSSSMSVVYCRSKFMGEWIDWRVIG